MAMQQRYSRRGAVLPLVALCSVLLMAMLALAIDIGMIAIARSQCQNAADAAAMAGARTISGNVANNYNVSSVPGNAIAAAVANNVLGAAVKANASSYISNGNDTYTSENVKIQAGAYSYTYDDNNAANEGFKIVFPKTDSTEPYSAVRATVTGAGNYAFGRIFGMSTFTSQATAVAVHRPRDVIIVMDLSGSMRFQSLPGIPYSGSRNTSMNPDPDYPKWGHYSDEASAGLFGNSQIVTGGEIAYYDPANISVSTDSGPPVLEYFFKNAAGVAPSTSNRAFARSSSTYSTTPGGDKYLKTQLNTHASNYAHTAKEFNNNSSNTIPKFEVNGYAHYNSPWNGYTEGPGYWGKTFFIWPPNPCGVSTNGTSPVSDPPSSITSTTYNWYNNGSRDWRQRFFVGVSGTTPFWIQDNTKLFDSSGNLRTPQTNFTDNGASYSFRINYAAILYWLQQTPVHFPSTIQAGRIRYYTAIPDGTDNTLNNRWWTTNLSSLPNNERFWKEYIDFVLGFYSSNGSSWSDYRSYIGNGNWYTWTGSSIQVSTRSNAPSKPGLPYMSGTTGAFQSVSGSSGSPPSGTSYFMSGNTTSSRSTNATTVPVSGISSSQITTDVTYVRFGSNSTVYKITGKSGSSTVTLTIAPPLAANVSSGATARFYSSNNATGKTTVSVNGLTSAQLTTNSDYVGFDGSTSDLYQFNAVTSKSIGHQLTLTTGLTASVSREGDSVEVYASNGTTGSSKMSVSLGSGSSTPVANKDFIVFGNDTANPYLITAATSTGSNRYILTLSPSLASNIAITGTAVSIFSPYMDYADDIKRPKHHWWFGPQTWVDWLGNYNTDKFGWPGNVPESQNWSCKIGIQTAIDDIKNNHPSDFIGLAFFSTPAGYTSGNNWRDGHHNTAIVPLGRNYQQLKDSLWFPPTTVTGGVSEIGPYDTDFENAPRANGGTSPDMGFRIAYNLLSSSITNLRLHATPTSTYRGTVGGLGRKGANRLIIFETDGAPNRCAYANFISSGSDSYYKVRIKHPTNISSSANEHPTVTTSNNYDDAFDAALDVVKQITALETASNPGYSTARKPALIYSLGYGSLFDPANAGTNQDKGLTFLQSVQYHGNTASSTNGANFPDWQRIYGTSNERIGRLQTAFTTIMQSGIQVSLIE